MLKDERMVLTSRKVNGDMSLLPAMSAQLKQRMATIQLSRYRAAEGFSGATAPRGVERDIYCSLSTKALFE